MRKPELKQFSELEPEDFEKHPVWIGCHTADYGKPWYESMDEETFRPWTGKLPVDLSEGMLLVKASFELRDGSSYTGFVTPSERPDDLGTQQPQIFVDGQRFGFWGGMFGISGDSQQAFYTALNKTPQEIFPFKFSGSAELATGIMTGHVNGFYLGGAIEIPKREQPATTSGPKWFRLQSWGYQPDPQPQKNLQYKKTTFHDICERCGIYSAQSEPFRFNKFKKNAAFGFWQPGCFFDALIVPIQIAQEMDKAGITGVLVGPILDHRSGKEISGHVQLHIAKLFACVETTHLQTVTCRPNNEEVTAFREKYPSPPKTEEGEKTKPTWWGDTEESYFKWKDKVRKEREKFMALPYCGRVKYDAPTSLAIIPSSLNGAHDLCQSAEWFGGGALAYRLTFVSERFAALVRERKWKGLMISEVPQHGFSERKGF